MGYHIMVRLHVLDLHSLGTEREHWGCMRDDNEI